MNYQTFRPHSDLDSFVKCYWTLEVPAASNHQKQKILPDGCIEMAFILGDDIRRYQTDEEFVLQPRSMVLGQTSEAFYIEPTGYVKTFAVRFYPYGFAKAVLKTGIEETEMDGIRMGLFSNDGSGVFVQLIKGDAFKPSQDGSIVYIAVERDLETVLEDVKANGGKILTPKTSIAPEMGYYALFIDTEGNRLGFYANN